MLSGFLGLQKVFHLEVKHVYCLQKVFPTSKKIIISKFLEFQHEASHEDWKKKKFSHLFFQKGRILV